MSGKSEEEDIEVINILQSNLQGIIVPGEAAESDEDDEQEHREGEDDTISIDDTSAKPSTPTEWSKPGPGSVDKKESYHTSKTIPKPSNTILHMKLRETTNNLNNHVHATFKENYKNATKELKVTSQSLMKTQLLVQEVSESLQQLTNNLFKLEDRLDMVTSDR
ncbi:PREDICTED: uncharacterized protein LOC106809420 [Priapulus caudatus]|uniref:Biogenesis of lysosome-related organelles complex 1 subunit 3 n=1 Tax=Priapulus caudatus TaxID=37621 RepID=A0ABM1E715_PRICU|nr:PREDICTED: uncharacterized protein LOC106809420 [Priapulus caudatus]